MVREATYFHGVNKDNTTKNRANDDYYSTPPEAVEYLLGYEHFCKDILEPCIGGGAIARVLTRHGHQVTGCDLVDRGYPNTIKGDFLKYNKEWTGDIITNPPYNIQTQFILHCLQICRGKVALLLKLSFLETIGRYEKIFQYNPPHRVYIFVKRINCLKNGVQSTGSSVCYCWYIWDNCEEYKETVLYWVPNHHKKRIRME